MQRSCLGRQAAPPRPYFLSLARAKAKCCAEGSTFGVNCSPQLRIGYGTVIACTRFLKTFLARGFDRLL